MNYEDALPRTVNEPPEPEGPLWGPEAVTHPIFCIGYTGIKPERLARIVGGLDAILVDIRYQARSRVPQWNKGALSRLVGSDRYAHLPALGNVLYKSGGMEIADYEGGREALRVLMEKHDRPALLLCACKEPDGCHRAVVATMLRADGFEVTELNAPGVVIPEAGLVQSWVQPDLFEP